MDRDLETLSERLAIALKARGLLLATAESCTGGWVSQVVTATAGCSEWFERGFVVYSNAAKQQLLRVRADSLREQGAVSEAVAGEMASGALKASRAGVALAITGIAGPSGASPGKPVGTVCFGWARRDAAVLTETQVFAGDREAVRRQSVITSLTGLLAYLET